MFMHMTFQRALRVTPLLLGLVGCGDDSTASPGGQGGVAGGTAGTGGAAAGTSSGGQAGQSGAGAAGAGAGGATTGGQAGTGGAAGLSGSSGQAGTGGASGGASAACPTALPGAATAGVWDERFTLAGVSGQDGVVPTVYDLARDADGSLLVAGYFRWIGATHVDGLARWRGDHFEPVGLSTGALEVPAGGFHAVAVSAKGVRAYAANYGTAQVHGGIWLDDGKGGVKEIGRYEGKVRRLLWVGDRLWVVGAFALDAGGPKLVASWDGAAWSGAKGGDPDDVVLEVVAEPDGSVLLGGQFTKVGGVAANRVARWDGTAWSGALGMPEGQAARVLTLARDASGQLHAGGLFTLGDEVSSSFARWSGKAWEIAGGGVAAGGLTGVVSQLVPDGDGFYVSGCFDRVQGGPDAPDSAPATGIARWDGKAWQPLESGQKLVSSAWFDFGVCGYEPDAGVVWNMRQQRLVKHDSALFVGGSFAGLGGVASQSLVSYEGASWKQVGEAGLGLSGSLRQVRGVGASCELYGLAAASHAGGTALSSPLLRFDQKWHEVGPAMPAGLTCSRFAIDAQQTPWLVCDDFASDSFGRLYRLREGAWEAVAPELPAVFDLDVAPDGALVVVGGGEKGFVARREGDAFTTVGEFDAVVLQLTFAPHANDAGHDLIVGGPFAKAGTVSASRVARWDGAVWSPLGEGSTNTPSALAATRDHVYMATQDEGEPGRKTLARWDGTQWTELATEANGLAKPVPDTVHTFLSIVPLDQGFLATGYVWPETGGRNVFHFDGTTFRALGGGAAAIDVASVALTPAGVWLGGSIAEVGGGDTLTSSVGAALYSWPTP